MKLTDRKAKKYKLIFESFGFTSQKKEYAPGEEVEISYMVATDTDYQFHVDVEKYEQDYDWKKGVIIRFPMPEHDVKISVTSRNSMMRDPNVKQPIDERDDHREPKKLLEGQWICPDCKAVNEGKFCHECGCKKPE